MSNRFKTFLNNVREAELYLPETKLPLGLSLYDFTMNAWFPCTFALAYLFITHHYNHKPRQNVIKGPLARFLVLLHNVLLTVFSMWTFYHVSGPVFSKVIKAYKVAGRMGCKHVLCDSDRTLWTDLISKYGYLFYLSKPYECIDTLIILLKGKRVQTLQSFHHAGAILAMWAGVRFQSIPILYFCLFNSFIHSIMYSYYTTAILHLPFPGFLKQALTSMQILQFIIGGAIAACYPFMDLAALDLPGFVRESGKCMAADSASAFAVYLNLSYLIPLTGLFARFYYSSYLKKDRKRAHGGLPKVLKVN